LADVKEELHEQVESQRKDNELLVHLLSMKVELDDEISRLQEQLVHAHVQVQTLTLEREERSPETPAAAQSIFMPFYAAVSTVNTTKSATDLSQKGCVTSLGYYL
jgi:hypothetical protein